jgi:hypothetical protein
MWLDNSSTTYDIDENIVDITIGKVQRNFKVENYLGATGGLIKGAGTYTPRNIIMTRSESLKSGDITAWNDQRNALIAFLTVRPDVELWFYMRDGENTKDLKIRVYPKDLGDEKFKNYNKIENRSLKLLAPASVFQNDNRSSGSAAITGSATQSVSITNSGNVECPPVFKFTPTVTETSFKVKLVNSYEFTLTGTFPAGLEVKYDMADNKMYINSIEYQTSQFLTSGSVFMLPVGTNSVDVTCSGAGTFAWEFYERYI